MKKHVAVIGMGFGDEGKGTMVEYFSSKNPEYKFVVRFSGGAQAAHNVVTPDGWHHTYRQFGSATHLGLRTLFIPGMMVNLEHLLEEMDSLGDAQAPIIDETCLLTLPYHVVLNQARETARGDMAHGSCGMGIGETTEFSLVDPTIAIRATDLLHPGILLAKLKGLHGYVVRKVESLGYTVDLDSPEEVCDDLVGMFMASGVQVVHSSFMVKLIKDSKVIFEGSQGILLDEHHGFHPNTTWSKVDATNIRTLLGSTYVDENVELVGVTRSYHTRHGNGPFPGEFPFDPEEFPEEHNTMGKFQGGWRVGHLNTGLLRLSSEAEDFDAIALTHADRVGKSGVFSLSSYYDLPKWDSPVFAPHGDDQLALRRTMFDKVSTPKEWASAKETDVESLINLVEASTNKPVKYLSFGNTRLHKSERRFRKS